MKQKIGILAAIGFAVTVLGANWSLNRWGFVSIGFGLFAPAGVYFAGLAFGLRDIVHETLGRTWVLAAIAVGAALSFLIEPDFAVASAVAFGLAELADLAVYEPLRTRNWKAAVITSNIVGSIIDSLLFLWIAFDSVNGWVDLTVGKIYMIAPAILFMGWVRRALLR